MHMRMSIREWGLEKGKERDWGRRSGRERWGNLLFLLMLVELGARGAVGSGRVGVPLFDMFGDRLGVMLRIPRAMLLREQRTWRSIEAEIEARLLRESPGGCDGLSNSGLWALYCARLAADSLPWEDGLRIGSTEGVIGGKRGAEKLRLRILAAGTRMRGCLQVCMCEFQW
jgi:hypothetical protein